MAELINIRPNNAVFHLTWIINNICTNHCDYCIPVLHEGKNHHYDWDRGREFALRIMNEVGTPINLSISGGEPTISPHFEELVGMFYDRGHTITVTSNGVRTPEWWDRIAPKICAVSFSYHPSYHDDTFTDTVIAASRHTHVTIRVMMDSRHWDRAVEMYRWAFEHPDIHVEAVRVLPETSRRMVGAEYTPEQSAWIDRYSKTVMKDRKLPLWRRWLGISSYYWSDGTYQQFGQSNHLIGTRQNNFHGWTCNIGIESLFIGWDGLVKKGNCMQGGHLFHINDHAGHPLPRSAEICHQTSCDCGTDVNLGKAKLNIDTSTIKVVKKPVYNEGEYRIMFPSKSDK